MFWAIYDIPVREAREVARSHKKCATTDTVASAADDSDTVLGIAKDTASLLRVLGISEQEDADEPALDVLREFAERVHHHCAPLTVDLVSDAHSLDTKADTCNLRLRL